MDEKKLIVEHLGHRAEVCYQMLWDMNPLLKWADEPQAGWVEHEHRIVWVRSLCFHAEEGGIVGTLRIPDNGKAELLAGGRRMDVYAADGESLNPNAVKAVTR